VRPAVKAARAVATWLARMRGTSADGVRVGTPSSHPSLLSVLTRTGVSRLLVGPLPGPVALPSAGMRDGSRAGSRARATWPVWAVSVVALVAFAVWRGRDDLPSLLVGAVAGGCGALVATWLVGRWRRRRSALVR
jgi:hypothetical protein